MSTPARRLVTPPEGVRIPTRTPATTVPKAPPTPAPRRPAEREAPNATRARRRARHHLGFVLLAGTLIGSMVFGIVVLNTLLAQASFRIDQAERRIEELSTERLSLVREQATLSAPGRIAAWALRHGMRLPDEIRILHVPDLGSTGPAGAGNPSMASAGGSGT